QRLGQEQERRAGRGECLRRRRAGVTRSSLLCLRADQASFATAVSATFATSFSASLAASSAAFLAPSRGGPISTGWNSTAAAIVVTSASAISLPMLDVPGWLDSHR